MTDEQAVWQKYGDIINLPHHVSVKHPAMPREKRAAQFAPFAALTGYGEVIKKTQAEHEAEVYKYRHGAGDFGDTVE